MELDRDAYLEGQILCIDKPYRWSSFQALNHVKWTLRKAFSLKKLKVGHAGTLDPLATGLLLVCTGKATKRIAAIQEMEKEYTGTLVLGAVTPSYDLETEPQDFRPTDALTEAGIRAAAEALTGEIRQRPPVFSAIRKDGKRLYEFARDGKEVEVPLRTVRVHAFDIPAVRLPEADFRITCSKGTYIRSLAHDLGQDLGCGAYLSALKRTKTGDFDVNKARTPEAFRQAFRDAGFPV